MKWNFDCFVIFRLFCSFWIMLTEHSQWHVRNDCHDIAFKRTPNHKRSSVPCTCLFELFEWRAYIHAQPYVPHIVVFVRTILLLDSSFTYRPSLPKTSHVFLGHLCFATTFAFHTVTRTFLVCVFRFVSFLPLLLFLFSNNVLCYNFDFGFIQRRIETFDSLLPS